jgi:hypothetical protein
LPFGLRANIREKIQAIPALVSKEYRVHADALAWIDSGTELHRLEKTSDTSGHVDVSLWNLVTGHRSKQLDYDRNEFKQVRWHHRNDVSKDGCAPELGPLPARMGMTQAWA